MATTALTRSEAFDQELASYQAHDELIRGLTRSVAGFKGCVGLGMTVAPDWNIETFRSGSQVFIPHHHVTWYTLQTLPRKTWRPAMRREVDLAAIRKTSFTTAGLPMIGPAAETFDYRCPDEREELLRIENLDRLRMFNALEWATTTTAFSYRKQWAEHRPSLFELVGVEDKNTPYLFFGESVRDMVPTPQEWMPRPYLAFANSNELFTRCTTEGMVGKELAYTDEFLDEFLDDLADGMLVRAARTAQLVNVHRTSQHVEYVFKSANGKLSSVFAGRGAKVTTLLGTEVEAGDVIGSDSARVPESFRSLSRHRQWHEAEKAYGQDLNAVIKFWFDRKVKKVMKGYTHIPASLAGLAAVGGSVSEHMLWDVEPGLDYFVSNAFVEGDVATPVGCVFPTIRIFGWDDLTFNLSGNVVVDLIPRDDRYVGYRIK